jgi:hypothetical protein
MDRKLAWTAVWYTAFLAGLAFATWRGMLAVHWFEEWSQARVSDPSEAELFEVNAWFETGFTLIGLVVAAGAVYLIRRRYGRRQDS